MKLSRPCRTSDVEEEKKPVTTYTIEGAYVNKDASLIGAQYEINENDSNNTGPLTDTSYMSFFDPSLNEESLSLKSRLPTDNDQNQYMPYMLKDGPSNFDITSINSDPNRMMTYRNPFPLPSLVRDSGQTVPDTTGNNMNDAQTTASYDHHPSMYLSNRMNTSNGHNTIRQNTYPDNIHRSIDTVSLRSLRQSVLASNPPRRSNSDLEKSDNRPITRPWTKHPRWVLRLSQQKRSHTPSLTGSRPSSRERPNNSLSSSARSTATIPRYAFYEE